MTPRTTMIIQSTDNDIRCETLGRDKVTGEWAGAISLYKRGSFHTILASSDPIFESPEKAIEEMQAIVDRIRDSDQEQLAL